MVRKKSFFKLYWKHIGILIAVASAIATNAYVVGIMSDRQNQMEDTIKRHDVWLITQQKQIQKIDVLSQKIDDMGKK